MIMNYEGPRVVRRSRLEGEYLLFSRIITYWIICSACISSSCNKCLNKSNAYLLIKFIFISHCMFKSNECVFFFPSLSLWKNIDQVAMNFLVPLMVKNSRRALTDKFVSPRLKGESNSELDLTFFPGLCHCFECVYVSFPSLSLHSVSPSSHLAPCGLEHCQVYSQRKKRGEWDRAVSFSSLGLSVCSLDSLLDASVGFWKLLWEIVSTLSLDLTLHLAWRRLVPLPGNEPVPSVVEAWSFNHWIAREVPILFVFW